MLKAVDNPNANGELGQGVMVTPEGGYVVAEPDLYAFLESLIHSIEGLFFAAHRGKNNSPKPKLALL